jgi:hypothetical protein
MISVRIAWLRWPIESGSFQSFGEPEPPTSAGVPACAEGSSVRRRGSPLGQLIRSARPDFGPESTASGVSLKGKRLRASVRLDSDAESGREGCG